MTMTDAAGPPFCEVHGCRGRWDADQPHTLCGKASTTAAAWLLIDVACAECRWDDSPPLVRILSVHKSAEDAKLAAEAEVRKPTWKPHPQGGEFFGFGSGDVWVVPVTAFTEPKITGDGVDG